MKRTHVPAVAAILLAGTAVFAQIESGDRGIAPLDSSSSIEIGGVAVDISGKNAADARLADYVLSKTSHHPPPTTP